MSTLLTVDKLYTKQRLRVGLEYNFTTTAVGMLLLRDSNSTDFRSGFAGMALVVALEAPSICGVHFIEVLPLLLPAINT